MFTIAHLHSAKVVGQQKGTKIFLGLK